MREQKQKKTSLGFTEIAQNVDPTTVMTGRQFVGSFACSLALLFSVISMASGCAMRPHGEIQKHHVQRSLQHQAIHSA